MPKNLQERASGVLCHLTSLPGPWGAGDLGPCASKFAAFLGQAGQSWWQMLPAHPTGAADSPYQALSAFAGNPLFISMEEMASKGWLAPADLEPPRPLMEDKADFGASLEFRAPRLRKAFEAMNRGGGDKDSAAAFAAFCERERDWLDDWALFAALKRSEGGRHWVEWPQGLRDAQRPSLAEAALRLEGEIRFEKFVQWLFDSQWASFKKKANFLGVGLVGDLPIFVSHDSADVWARRELFDLDPAGQPTKVAGVPPDYFSEDGQRWGNPLYRWDIHRATGYRWWIARMHRLLRLFDAVRVDHFIGFHRYWEIPAESASAKNGAYQPGPGAGFFEALQAQLGSLPIIAEDLGVVTPEVDQLRERFNFPGMRVLQFSFGGDARFLPGQYPELSAAYTGTHDNNTTLGWLEEFPPAGASHHQAEAWAAERRRAEDYASNLEQGRVWPLIAACLQSKARLAVTPLQDLLELGGEARMNVPGTMDGNWRWRCKPGLFTPELAARLRKLTLKYDRG